MRTTSYADLKSRFTSAIGVDSLLSVEETAFKNSLNDRVRQIWTRHRWPPLTAVVSKTLAAVDTSTLKADKAVRIDNASDLYDVYDVFTKNPFEDNTARRLKFSLVNGYLVVNKDVSETTVYVTGSQVPSDDYGGATTTVPQFMDRMLLAYACAEYYRADGQLEKAMAEEQRAEEYFNQEVDRFQRLEQQNQIQVNTYPAYWPTMLVSQTTT
ncbi:hypothetical protein OAK38_06160 [Verrucomicrobia bacterium]|nr:hypothetical protein [Verrucomicrobiota bacterium]